MGISTKGDSFIVNGRCWIALVKIAYDLHLMAQSFHIIQKKIRLNASFGKTECIVSNDTQLQVLTDN